MKNNPLLLWTIVAIVVYWMVGLATPNPVISSASSALLLVASSIMFFRYAPTAWDILFHQKRDGGEGGEGSHLGVYGATLIAAGSSYVGMFGLLWVIADQPQTWLGTAYSGFGRAVAAIGFVLMAFSPNVSSRTVRPVNLIMVALVLIAVAVASFFVGTRAAMPEPAPWWSNIKGRLADRPPCPPDRPVWGSSNKVYHVDDSPYRSMVIPDRCFSDIAEAESKGYRAPKQTKVAEKSFVASH